MIRFMANLMRCDGGITSKARHMDERGRDSVVETHLKVGLSLSRERGVCHFLRLLHLKDRIVHNSEPTNLLRFRRS